MVRTSDPTSVSQLAREIKLTIYSHPQYWTETLSGTPHEIIVTVLPGGSRCKTYKPHYRYHIEAVDGLNEIADTCARRRAEARGTPPRMLRFLILKQLCEALDCPLEYIRGIDKIDRQWCKRSRDEVEQLLGNRYVQNSNDKY